MIESTDWAWLAGFLDGEGSFQTAVARAESAFAEIDVRPIRAKAKRSEVRGE